MNTEFDSAMEEISTAIMKAGYDPYEQLYGYVSTGKEEYITRSGGAREKIKQLNWQWVWDYVKEMEKST